MDMNCICLLENNALVLPHYGRLSDLAKKAGSELEWQGIRNGQTLKRELQNNSKQFMYILAHSLKDKGLELADRSFVSATDLSAFLSHHSEALPRIIFFNTCYGMENKFAEACFSKGVEQVILAKGSVNSQSSLLCSELFFDNLLLEKQSVETALDSANTKIFNENVFELYQNKTK